MTFIVPLACSTGDESFCSSLTMLLINILSRRDAGRLLCCASLAIGLAVALDPQQRLVASDPSRYVPKVPYGYFDGQGYFVMDEDRPLTTAVAQEPLGEEARHCQYIGSL